MASWGDIAVGEQRPTFDHPSKSAIMGLLAAAIGIRREDDEKHYKMTDGYNFSVIVNSSGVMLNDYHTTQVPPAKYKKVMNLITRKDELAVPHEDLNTILSTREYYCDALYTICLWSRTNNPPYSLEMLAQKLKEPEFVLYLGRKSCPLAMPTQAQVVSASNLKEAFVNVCFKDTELLFGLPKEKSIRLYWESDDDTGLQAVHTITRRDTPISRRRWQFTDRKEHYAIMPANQEEH